MNTPPPTTLEAALIQIRQVSTARPLASRPLRLHVQVLNVFRFLPPFSKLELQNKALSKQVDKNTSRQQHMVVTLAKIGKAVFSLV